MVIATEGGMPPGAEGPLFKASRNLLRLRTPMSAAPWDAAASADALEARNASTTSTFPILRCAASLARCSAARRACSGAPAAAASEVSFLQASKQ